MKKIESQRILGIDPGFGRTGWGVIEKVGADSSRGGQEWQLVAYGCIETSAKKDFISRVDELHFELVKVIKKYKPTRSGVEDLFFAKNVTTAMKVGQARGVILLTLHQAEIPIDEFTPLQIKQALTGYGRAEKGQVQKMVEMILQIKKKIRPDDAADALAVAITCGASMKMRSKTSVR
ncbi:MAG: crossover junction endodeoxyribonuclease RuvC [Candidatus Magasanikbacteria bacterium]|jgi:crossover junction endodeoxyribonuclease RuvC|nr:crossover junction endodeoxyribonuclease RuvC [Candidatus Magasanikbacteria bacterium]MBT4315222.1 crossover junction endodeoxyribonuclease RuvC [Candidatus Magasanikbacteria bacterium]MBT4547132.1 crossover junction endodeoxyribonuclease RuvC [Candidatus Magasanikbacteria bacterium]MBT6819098.1 crossover junction endodeoxyribonuclease RuvC [Candidatus Magasanikbacteria bacterium]